MNSFDTISWQLVTLIVTILIGVPTLVFTFLTIKRKTISYETITSLKIISIRKEIGVSEKLKISFDGKNIENICFYEIELCNSGNSPILREDFETPLLIDFTGKGKILSCEIVTTKPSDFHPDIVVQEMVVYIEPTLINKGERFTLRFLIDQLTVDFPVIQGRIIGTKINNKKYSLKKIFEFILPYLAAFTGIGLSVLPSFFTSQSKDEIPFIKSTMFYVLLIAIFTFVSIRVISEVINKNNKKKKKL